MGNREVAEGVEVSMGFCRGEDGTNAEYFVSKNHFDRKREKETESRSRHRNELHRENISSFSKRKRTSCWQNNSTTMGAVEPTNCLLFGVEHFCHLGCAQV